MEVTGSNGNNIDFDELTEELNTKPKIAVFGVTQKL